MAQYINKNALVAELERLARLLPKEKGVSMNLDWARNTLSCLYLFLNALEVKEVDFETAFAASIDHFDEKNNYGQWTESDLRVFAEHFFELGINTQKGE